MANGRLKSSRDVSFQYLGGARADLLTVPVYGGAEGPNETRHSYLPLLIEKIRRDFQIVLLPDLALGKLFNLRSLGQCRPQPAVATTQGR